MQYVKVGPRHQITIPQKVRDAAGICAGDLLEAVVEKGRVVLVPAQVTPRPAVARLSAAEQDLLRSARQKVASIQRDLSKAEGLTPEEADVAAKAGLIDHGQRWWWTEEWQAGEREATGDVRDGRMSAPFARAEDLKGHLRGGHR